jgi:pSer/pThr/pTyr-binding forkhead associated (FHA) protein
MYVELVNLAVCACQKRIRLDSLPAILGRDPGADVQLNDQWASPCHCRLEYVDGELVVSDLGSLRGTFINGIPMLRKTLRPGDTLGIGVTRFQVFWHSSDRDELSGGAEQPCRGRSRQA